MYVYHVRLLFIKEREGMPRPVPNLCLLRASKAMATIHIHSLSWGRGGESIVPPFIGTRHFASCSSLTTSVVSLPTRSPARLRLTRHHVRPGLAWAD